MAHARNCGKELACRGNDMRMPLFPTCGTRQGGTRNTGRTVIDFILTPCASPDLNDDHVVRARARVIYIILKVKRLLCARDKHTIFAIFVQGHGVRGVRCFEKDKLTALSRRTFAMCRASVMQIERAREGCFNNISRRPKPHIIHDTPSWKADFGRGQTPLVDMRI